jgi:hypothetical protein
VQHEKTSFSIGYKSLIVILEEVDKTLCLQGSVGWGLIGVVLPAWEPEAKVVEDGGII